MPPPPHRTLRHYAYAGHRLTSAFSLPELASARATLGEPDFTVSAAPQAIQEGEQSWLHHWLDGEDANELSLARVDDGYLLRFPDLADIVLSDNGQVQIVGVPGVSARSLRHLLLDQALPRMLAHRGKLVLHASAATIADGSAILFLGLSGQGKSTLASALAAQSGGVVLADDCVVAAFDGPRLLAVPSYSGLRLWSDSLAELFPECTQTRRVNDYTDKLRVAVTSARKVDHAGWPVAAILVLDSVEPDDADREIRMAELDSSRACMALVSNTFQLDVSDVQQVYRLLGLAAEAAERAPILTLHYPHDYSALPHVVRAILEHPVVAKLP